MYTEKIKKLLRDRAKTQVREEDAENSLTSDEGRAASVKKADVHRMAHNAYMEEYVSIMRIRFSWAIFSMILVWLLAILYLIGISAVGCMHFRFFLIISGLICGGIVGTLLGNEACKRLNEKELQEVYMYPQGDRKELVDRNIQLRVMRSGGDIRYVVWLTLLGGVMGWIISLFPAIGDLVFSFKLSDAIILTLIGTTTVTVLGLFAIVLHWLFPRK